MMSRRPVSRLSTVLLVLLALAAGTQAQIIFSPPIPPALINPSATSNGVSTTFTATVEGNPGQYVLVWERGYGTPSHSELITYAGPGPQTFMFTVPLASASLDRTRVDDVITGATQEVCDGDWAPTSPPPPGAISASTVRLPPPPLLGCVTFELVSDPMVPPPLPMVACSPSAFRGIGRLSGDSHMNVKATILHNLPNATNLDFFDALDLLTLPPGTATPLMSFTSPSSPARAFFTLDATSANVLVNNRLVAQVSSATQCILGLITFSSLTTSVCQVFMSEVCPDPGIPPTGLDTNRDGAINSQDDEFIEIVNGAEVVVDISGWQICVDSVVQHEFATGTRLLPNEAITVFGGGQLGRYGAIGFNGATAFDPVAMMPGALLLPNTGTHTVELLDGGGATIDTMMYTDPPVATSLTRVPQTPVGTFVNHPLIPHSAGLFNDGVLPFPVFSSYPGNGSDVAIVVERNGVISAPVTHVHPVAPNDVFSIEFFSPDGTLTGQPLLAVGQIFPSIFAVPDAIAFPGDPVPSIIFNASPTIPTFVILDGFSTVGIPFSPTVGSSLTGIIPSVLQISGQVMILQCLVIDSSINLFQLGTAPPHEFLF